MSTFDEREKGYEAKFAHDQENAFKIAARRNKLLALWAAGKIGLSGGAADTYAKELVAAEVEAGIDGIVRKIMHDVAAKGAKADEAEVRRQFDALTEKAKAEVLKK
ncbi:MAG TPA: DUF1476 domain-containing protein [Candidatus Cybelea sp.]|nr:DUF1476 domain-containing protein [Candidatus Cybelea sp.]